MKFCLLLISYTVLSPFIFVVRFLFSIWSFEIYRFMLLLMKILPPIFVASAFEDNFYENSKHSSSSSFFKLDGNIWSPSSFSPVLLRLLVFLFCLGSYFLCKEKDFFFRSVWTKAESSGLLIYLSYEWGLLILFRIFSSSECLPNPVRLIFILSAFSCSVTDLIFRFT